MWPPLHHIMPLLPPTLPFRCRFLPLLPPRTSNVTWRQTAKRLELRIRGEYAPGAKSKSGKSGNVDHPSQLCHRGCGEEVRLLWPELLSYCLLYETGITPGIYAGESTQRDYPQHSCRQANERQQRTPKRCHT